MRRTLIVCCVTIMSAVALPPATVDPYAHFRVPVAQPVEDRFEPLKVQGKSISDNSYDTGNLDVLEPQEASISDNSFDTVNLNFLEPQELFISDNSFATDNLGVLEPQEVSENEDFSAIMLDLLPNFIDILRKFGGSNGKKLSVTEIVSSFFPIVRKAVEAKAQSEGRNLTSEETKTLSLSETSIYLATGVMESINEKDSPTKVISTIMSIARPILESNAANNDRTLNWEEKTSLSQIENAVTFTLETLRDMNRDNSTFGIVSSNLRVARYTMEARAKAENRQMTYEELASLAQASNAVDVAFRIINDFNGLDTNLSEMVPTIMRLTKFLFESRAQNHSRLVTYDEEEFLRFTESTMSTALNFIQDIINGDASAGGLEQFIATTRTIFEERAISKGRTSISPELEDNLQITERALGLALSVMREMQSDAFKPHNITISI